jgi:hypothetical protein
MRQHTQRHVSSIFVSTAGFKLPLPGLKVGFGHQLLKSGGQTQILVANVKIIGSQRYKVKE